jgi:GNAT superfamily N-acetyltransferase
MFTIRRATLDDLDEFIQLRLQLFRETGDLVSDEVPPDLLEATRTYLLANLPTNRFIAWIAEVEGILIGISGVVFLEKPPTRPNLSGKEAYVMNMYTVPEWRGKGVATALLQEILQFVKVNTIPRVWLRTTQDAKHLYEENGFTATKDEMEWLWQQE